MTAVVDAPSTATARVMVDGPGVYDLPMAAYHADPVPGGSLTSSGARMLTPPNTPAHFRWWVDNPRTESTDAFDLGHAAHRLILGKGEELAVVDAKDWRTKAAQEAKRAARDAGQVPLLPPQLEAAQGMAAAVFEHPWARVLLAPGSGDPERTVVWRDQRTGVMRRCCVDWLRHPTAGRRLFVVDVKTCDRADPRSVGKAVATYGYHQQGAWYLDGVRAADLDPAGDAVYVLVFVETRPPHLVHVVQLGAEALRWADQLNDTAIDLYAECSRTGVWPGYPADDIPVVDMPRWAQPPSLDTDAMEL